jgi:hypothetical protein
MNLLPKSNQQIAVELLQFAINNPSDQIIISNISAVELVRFLAPLIITCPKCGSEAWCNIDCDLCSTCSFLKI